MHTHADEGAAVVQNHALSLQAVSTGPHHLRDTLIKGIAKRNVTDYTSLEESERPDTLRPVNDLVWDNEVAGLDLLLQAADGGEGDNGTHTDGAKSGDVGARGDLVGSDLVVQAMSAEKGNSDCLVIVFVMQDGNRGGGVAPWCHDVERRSLSEAGRR